MGVKEGVPQTHRAHLRRPWEAEELLRRRVEGRLVATAASPGDQGRRRGRDPLLNA